MNSKTSQVMQDRIIKAAATIAPFPGWSLSTLAQAARNAGLGDDMPSALWPGGVGDAVAHFADMADREMLKSLNTAVRGRDDWHNLKVRERIRRAVLARLSALQKYKEAERAAIAFWASRPSRKFQGLRCVWRTADRIWDRAGDTSTDYNRYTKRALLSAVLASTILAWLGDEDTHMRATQEFLDRRIAEVLKLGQAIGRFKRKETA